MDIRIPRLGEGAESGSVVNILVKEGDAIKKDQTILELENEKAVAPIPSPSAGVIKKIYIKVGDKVSVGQAIASLSDGGAEVVTAKENSKPVESKSFVQPTIIERPKSSPVASSQDYVYESKSGVEPPASPSVRKIARDLGIDLTRVKGSQHGGRIVVEDLRAYIQNLQARASSGQVLAPSSETKATQHSEKIDFSKWGKVQIKKASSLRIKIGEKMVESWSAIPHVTQFDEANITSLMALRKKHVASYEKKKAKLTITPFIMKAVVAALKKYPIVNSSFDEASGEIIYKDYFHLGIAVDTEQGLIVPVLRDVDKKSMLEIALELDAIAEKTRQRKISIDELKGGSFTISNLGSIGGTFFTPIINKPEVAILGVGRGVLKPVVIKGKTKDTIEPALMLPLGLSYDHRVVDGADGARFIRAVVENLENFSNEDAKIS